MRNRPVNLTLLPAPLRKKKAPFTSFTHPFPSHPRLPPPHTPSPHPPHAIPPSRGGYAPQKMLFPPKKGGLPPKRRLPPKWGCFLCGGRSPLPKCTCVHFGQPPQIKRGVVVVWWWARPKKKRCWSLFLKASPLHRPPGESWGSGEGVSGVKEGKNDCKDNRFLPSVTPSPPFPVPPPPPPGLCWGFRRGLKTTRGVLCDGVSIGISSGLFEGKGPCNFPVRPGN